MADKEGKCKQCRAKFMYRPSQQRGMFCDNQCQHDYRWEKETKPRIRAGLVDNPWTLKKYLIEKYGEKCKLCGQGPLWKKKPLMLQLDHKDGDSDHNLPRNLRLLCPNCHTQTPTHGSKGVGNRYKKVTKRNQYLRSYKAGA